tara:strand:- start:3984 stop:4316 length:333 start_codon:yes stop_codon:yes gene_type:complete
VLVFVYDVGFLPCVWEVLDWYDIGSARIAILLPGHRYGRVRRFISWYSVAGNTLRDQVEEMNSRYRKNRSPRVLVAAARALPAVVAVTAPLESEVVLRQPRCSRDAESDE